MSSPANRTKFRGEWFNNWFNTTQLRFSHDMVVARYQPVARLYFVTAVFAGFVVLTIMWGKDWEPRSEEFSLIPMIMTCAIGVWIWRRWRLRPFGHARCVIVRDADAIAMARKLAPSVVLRADVEAIELDYASKRSESEGNPERTDDEDADIYLRCRTGTHKVHVARYAWGQWGPYFRDVDALADWIGVPIADFREVSKFRLNALGEKL